jgi:cytochrome P450
MQSNLPPGPRDPRVNTYKWMVKPAACLEDGQKRFGDIWTLRMLKQTTFLVTSSPALIKEVFSADPTVLHAGEANMMIGTALLGEYSVVLLDEDVHTAQRQLLLPHFGNERVARYHDVMARICEEDLATWPLHEPMELLPRMQAITRRVIMTAIFGVTGGEAQERLEALIRTLLDWGARAWNMAKLHRASRREGGEMPKDFLERRDPLDAAVYEEIERARRDPHLEERDDILAMLVQGRHEDGSPVTDREVRDQMITLLIQGHTSTATALSWALERLIRHPDKVERLRAETEDGDAYLDAVVWETLRLRPPNPIVVRKVNQPFRLGEYDLEVGTVIAPCIYLLHRRADLYPEPERFRPERFLEEPVDPYKWIPFGGGDRYCIGRNFAVSEIKSVLRTVLRQARLAPVEQRDEQIKKRGILLSPTGSTRAVVEERMPAAAVAVGAE